MKGPVLAPDPTLITGRRDVHSNNFELGIDHCEVLIAHRLGCSRPTPLPCGWLKKTTRSIKRVMRPSDSP